MPIHDWTKVDAGLVHHFHHFWTDSLCVALNDGVLPPEYFAIVEQNIRGPIPDVLTLELTPASGPKGPKLGGRALAEAPPRAPLVQQTEAEIYLSKADRISVRRRHGLEGPHV